MTIRLSYLLTVIVSVSLIVIGNKIAVDGMVLFRDDSQEIAEAKVEGIIERIGQNEDFDEYVPVGGRLIFEAKITSGMRKGEPVTAIQSFSNISRGRTKEVGRGDSILIIFTNNEWYFNGYVRTNKMLGLGILFTLSVLVFGRKKGFNTVLSLGLTCGAVFAVFVPSVLSGKNIYLMSILVCVYTITMTLLLVIGFNKKALTAAIGCGSGVMVTGKSVIVIE